MADLPKKKPVPPVPYGDNDVNDYMQGKTTKKQLLARVDDRFGRKDPMEDMSILEEQQRLSQNMKKIGFKKGGAVKGKSVPQSQKKNRKKI